MNNKQKLHQIKLTQWAARFQEQAASGLTVKAWCVSLSLTPCFFSAENPLPKLRGYFGKVMASYFFTNV